MTTDEIMALADKYARWEVAGDFQPRRDALYAAIEALQADARRMREALIWYRDEAAALAKHVQSRAHTQAVLASLTVLSLDAGQRADAAMALDKY